MMAFIIRVKTFPWKNWWWAKAFSSLLLFLFQHLVWWAGNSTGLRIRSPDFRVESLGELEPRWGLFSHLYPTGAAWDAVELAFPVQKVCAQMCWLTLWFIIPWGKTNPKSWSLIDFEIGPHFNSQVLSVRATFNMVLKYLMQKSARVIDWNIYLNINELRFAKMRSPCCHGHKCLTFWFAFLL